MEVKKKKNSWAKSIRHTKSCYLLSLLIINCHLLQRGYPSLCYIYYFCNGDCECDDTWFAFTGVDDNETIRVYGSGGADPDGNQPGDLYVTIKV